MQGEPLYQPQPQIAFSPLTFPYDPPHSQTRDATEDCLASKMTLPVLTFLLRIKEQFPSCMCKGGWIEYAGGNYPVKLQKYKNDVKYLQIFRGGGIESAGGNYRVKLPPQSPQCSVWL